MSAIDETTVVLPGPAGSMDLFLNGREVAQMFALLDRPDGTPVLPPGIEAELPVDVNAPFVGGLDEMDDTTKTLLTLGAVGLGLFLLTRI